MCITMIKVAFGQTYTDIEVDFKIKASKLPPTKRINSVTIH